MPKSYKYNDSGIRFNNVPSYGSTFSTGPLVLANTHTYDGDTVTIDREDAVAFNAVDIYWNKAVINDQEIETTGLLLNLIKNLSSGGGTTNYATKDSYGIVKIGDGINVSNGVISAVKGDKGDKGDDGTKVTISDDGYWELDGRNTGIRATGGSNDYILPVATTNALGGIKVGYDTNENNYAVQLDANNRAYVTIPSGSPGSPEDPGEENPDSNPTVEIVNEIPECEDAQEGVLYIVKDEKDNIVLMYQKVNGICIPIYLPEPAESYGAEVISEEEFYNKQEAGTLDDNVIYIVKNNETLIGLGLHKVLTRVPVPVSGKVVKLTKAEYDALDPKDATTIYLITDTNEIYVGGKKLSTAQELKSEVTSMFSQKFNFDEETGELSGINWGALDLKSDGFYATIGSKGKKDITEVIKLAGFISTDSFSTMFASEVDNNGEIVKKAEIITAINEAGESEAKISGDKIQLTAENIVNIKYGEDSNGNTIGEILANADGLSSRVSNIEGTGVFTSNFNLTNKTIDLIVNYVDEKASEGSKAKTGTISLGFDEHDESKIILNADSIYLNGQTIADVIDAKTINTENLKTTTAEAGYIVFYDKNNTIYLNVAALSKYGFYFGKKGENISFKSEEDTWMPLENQNAFDTYVMNKLNESARSRYTYDDITLYDTKCGLLLKTLINSSYIHLTGETGTTYINNGSMSFFNTSLTESGNWENGMYSWLSDAALETKATQKMILSERGLLTEKFSSEEGITHNMQINNASNTIVLWEQLGTDGDVLKLMSLHPSLITMYDTSNNEISSSINILPGSISAFSKDYALLLSEQGLSLYNRTTHKGFMMYQNSIGSFEITDTNNNAIESFITSLEKQEESQSSYDNAVAAARENVSFETYNKGMDEYKSGSLIFSKYTPDNYNGNYNYSEKENPYDTNKVQISKDGLYIVKENFGDRGYRYRCDFNIGNSGDITWTEGQSTDEGFKYDENNNLIGELYYIRSGQAKLRDLECTDSITCGIVQLRESIVDGSEIVEQSAEISPTGIIGFTNNVKTFTIGKNQGNRIELDLNISDPGIRLYTYGYDIEFKCDDGGVRIGALNGRFEFYDDSFSEPAILTASEFSQDSDQKLKNILSETSLTVEQIADAPAVNFLWKNSTDNKVNVGTIAQYWLNVLPEVVAEHRGNLTMNYSNAAMVASIVTAKEVVALKNKVSELEAENTKLKIRLAQIEEKLGL